MKPHKPKIRTKNPCLYSTPILKVRTLYLSSDKGMYACRSGAVWLNHGEPLVDSLYRIRIYKRMTDGARRVWFRLEKFAGRPSIRWGHGRFMCHMALLPLLESELWKALPLKIFDDRKFYATIKPVKRSYSNKKHA